MASTPSAILLIALGYRIFVGWGIGTTFVPDEYFQTVEPAFFMLNGTVNVNMESELTWEWREPFCIRSFIGVLHYVPVLLLGRTLGIDGHIAGFVLSSSRLMQSCLAYVGDLCYYRLLIHITNSENLALGCFLAHMFSWSYSYCICRTLANSTETNLTLIALFAWYHRTTTTIATEKEERSSKHPSSLKMLSLTLAAIIVWCRPSAVLFWAPFTLLHAARLDNPWDFITKNCLPLGFSVAALAILFDSYCYGVFSITPYNFFTYNIAKNYAEIFYGAKPWHWNFSNGLPVMLGLYLPLLLYSWCYIPQHREIHRLNILAVVYILVLSCVTRHQEYRFLLPLMPFFHMSVGYLVSKILEFDTDVPIPVRKKKKNPPVASTSTSTNIKDSDSCDGDNNDKCLLWAYLTNSLTVVLPFSTNACKRKVALNTAVNSQPQEEEEKAHNTLRHMENQKPRSTTISRIMMASIFVLNFALAAYLSTRHQSGAESAFLYLAREFQLLTHSAVESSSASVVLPAVKVLLLAPCHSFPGYSILNNPKINLTLVALDCSPDRRLYQYPPYPVYRNPFQHPLKEQQAADEEVKIVLTLKEGEEEDKILGEMHKCSTITGSVSSSGDSGDHESTSNNRFACTDTHIATRTTNDTTDSVMDADCDSDSVSRLQQENSGSNCNTSQPSQQQQQPLLLTESQLFEKSSAQFIINTNTETDTDTESQGPPYCPAAGYWSQRGQEADFIVTFDAYMEELYPLLKTRGYEQVAVFHHADFRYDLDDPKPKKRVHVLRKTMLP